MFPGSPTISPLINAIAKTVRQVPRGRVSTYGAIAKAAGYPRCARQVGYTLRRMQGLPWQRILGSGGRIAVKGEYAMEQRFLLEAEGVRFKGRRVDLALYEHRFTRKSPAKRQSSSPRKGPRQKL